MKQCRHPSDVKGLIHLETPLMSPRAPPFSTFRLRRLARSTVRKPPDPRGILEGLGGIHGAVGEHIS